MSTIPGVLRAAAAAAPDREAVVTPESRLTFAQLLERVQAGSAACLAHGIGHGDRVAVWGPNTMDWVIASLSLTGIGAIVVPVNSRFKGEEARYLLDRTGATALVVDDEFLTPLLGTDPLDALGNPEVLVIRTSRIREFLSRADEVPLETVEKAAAEVGDDDPSDIIFTSGTTGAPKGAMLRHGASVRLYAAWSDVVGLRHGDRYLLIYPLFHTAGLKSGLLASLLKGATLLPHLVFDPQTVMTTVQAERVTMLPGPPAIYQTILNTDVSEYDLSSLRLAVTGAAVVPIELVVKLREDLGFDSVVTGYGLTETTGTVAMCRHDDDPEIIAHTSGRPLDGIEMKIVDADGNEVPTGEQGEIVTRGYQVMIGYFDNPEATAETVDADGWLHTGDVGYVDAQNNVTITDRIKDMFIVGGFNAYPAEIEGLMLEHPDLAQVAIVGVPDARMGEVGMAVVVPAAGHTVERDEVLAWAREHMANFKAPRYLEVVDALPLNASGKVLKFELRERGRELTGE
jgi:acyl-CoA synthetase (AMP-forming)/AMP-acid ligase II